MGRILAIDYGQKRVGLAVTDPLKIIANGLTTVGSGQIFKFLADYLQKEDVELFVVGHPRQMNYEDSASMRLIEPFVRGLKNKFPQIPVKMVDERFTSVLAHQAMLDGGLKKKARQNKALVDEISATIILQSYMESLRNGSLL
ncbi:MAG: Holliday junction resolvase RuvX [Paludibacteraceae bacterium]|nr:Holliday junction resolvase RuvX [Paludibacteraceae bacterium]